MWYIQCIHHVMYILYTYNIVYIMCGVGGDLKIKNYDAEEKIFGTKLD